MADFRFWLLTGSRKYYDAKFQGQLYPPSKFHPNRLTGVRDISSFHKNHSYFEWSCLFLDIFHIERGRPGKSHKAILIEKKILYRMSIVSAINPHQPMVKFIPFSKKVNFRRKFMVFPKNFFAQKNQQKKLHNTVQSKSV